MSHRRNTAICLGFCALLAACDSAQPTDPSPSGLSPAASADLPTLANSWMAKRTLSPDRQVMAAGTINGIIYVVGGRHIDWNTFIVRLLARVDAYNVATNTWSRVASMPGPREEPNGASMINGKLYVTGGRGSALTPEGFFKPTKTLFVYDPRSNTWTRKRDMPQVGCGGVQGVINGMLYVYMPSVRWCDTFGSGGTVVRFYRYNPATDTWVSRAIPPSGSGSGGVINGKFYLAGPDSRLHVYDPMSNTWTTRASMPESRDGMAAAVLNGKLYLVGGFNASSEFPLRTLEVYNPQTNRWMLQAGRAPPGQREQADPEQQSEPRLGRREYEAARRLRARQVRRARQGRHAAHHEVE